MSTTATLFKIGKLEGWEFFATPKIDGDKSQKPGIHLKTPDSDLDENFHSSLHYYGSLCRKLCFLPQNVLYILNNLGKVDDPMLNGCTLVHLAADWGLNSISFTVCEAGADSLLLTVEDENPQDLCENDVTIHSGDNDYLALEYPNPSLHGDEHPPYD
ncbi:hypothetical protein A6R68_07407 [Neotoma lepida]|uniref:Uncharacterized protein n=1 Tax=Neotoma lepida TaxID=56216 RepID=A0A1A6GE73_NEOLE|nr:hypothetical protein A6R68_07407 [Neotoma lepida]